MRIPCTDQAPEFWRHHVSVGLVIHESAKGWRVYAWDGQEAHDMTGEDVGHFATLDEADAFARMLAQISHGSVA